MGLPQEIRPSTHMYEVEGVMIGQNATGKSRGGEFQSGYMGVGKFIRLSETHL